ncbi:threonyl-tRNA synthetase [Coemansia sp. RSA 1807]|nr:threonyl-tRNA synthetase [Coemansia sp. RSA 1938]KAJ2143632.1 threonyl-tRNA synthetase [Coemansia sp. RSA 564]KAJ2272345.1 threonyl-tRNA synthetase [Coemansia sp. RSA 451]KAJ2294830.1 threonyl-tRNA synthetase [Coemansia sp. RSA 355]KAJ2405558.1 threonyl-tRNA synthetase [Coemansia sp. RSA 2526]KAJ2574142.1 threonyl-tRNA synthetase [Coemansia sp. RSA 1807]
MAELAEQTAKLALNDKAPAKAGKAKKGSGAPAPQIERPEFIEHRNRIFEELYQIQQDKVAKMPREPIVVTLPDGSTREGMSWETTPMDIANGISKSLAKRLVIAKVNGVLWDTLRPLEGNTNLELLDFETEEGKTVYWHSSAHVLGEACELHFGCHLCNGPPVENGFYYDISVPEEFGRAVSQTDYAPLEHLATKAIKEKQPFQRLELTKEDLLRMFGYNKYKVHLINDKVPDGTSTTVYRCGPLIDLCRGPHVPNTGNITAFAVMKNSASYFLGNPENDSLQRIYGISFPDKKMMAAHKLFLEEAAKRDHRKIGREQELFFFHEMSPGSAFFLPHGTRIYNTLMSFIREQYWQRGFEEVVSPNMFNVNLWKQSGHWDNYKDDMFDLEVEKEKFALKPMNCPGHCLMFGMRDRSYRELPIRFADFGVLHRNEASGALTGLTRVRRFQQDDAHIFCMQSQVKDEMRGALDFMSMVYGTFGFTFALKLSTRPEKFLGEIAVWDQAEQQLRESLDEFGAGWELNPGDGAFYGPKVDITIRDALGREFQCATIQLDFQLPERFHLQFRTGTADEMSGFQRPVIIHRAVLGSVERMIAILTENFAGKWPLWLSPRQVMVVPVTGVVYEYAEKVKQQLHEAGYFVDVDVSADTLNKKIRNAEIAQYNFICVVGAQEMEEGSVNVRCRDDVGTKAKGQTVPVTAFVQQMDVLKNAKSLESKLA